MLTEQCVKEPARAWELFPGHSGGDAILTEILENLPDLVVMADARGCIGYVNRPMPESVASCFIGSPVADLVAAGDRQRFEASYDQAMHSQQPTAIEVQSAGGRWRDCRIVPTDGDDAGLQAAVVFTDVTRRRRAEERADKARRLLERVLDAYDSQRQCLADQVHEQLAQRMAAALMHLEAFELALEQEPDQVAGHLRTATELLADAVDEARKIANGLRRPVEVREELI
jgi:PAS domain S-box-containing protein